MASSPTSTVSSGIVPTGSGDRLGTMDSKTCVAESPSESVAVIVTLAVPFATAVTVTVDTETETPATPELDDRAV